MILGSHNMRRAAAGVGGDGGALYRSDGSVYHKPFDVLAPYTPSGSGGGWAYQGTYDEEGAVRVYGGGSYGLANGNNLGFGASVTNKRMTLTMRWKNIGGSGANDHFIIIAGIGNTAYSLDILGNGSSIWINGGSYGSHQVGSHFTIGIKNEITIDIADTTTAPFAFDVYANGIKIASGLLMNRARSAYDDIRLYQYAYATNGNNFYCHDIKIGNGLVSY